MKKIIFSLLISILSSESVLAFTTTAKSAYLIDFDSGEVIYEKNADELMAPSSMLKLMTLYMLFDSIERGKTTLETEMSVSENADFNLPKFYTASKICLEKGQKLKAIDAIRGIIVMSGGDASVVVAEHLSGSEEKFASDMEKMARKIGMEKSTFANATGLPDKNNLMTSRELAILAEKIIRKYPDLYEYFKLKSFEYDGYKNDWCKTWGENHTSNYNKLLFMSPSSDGLKTGHTVEGGYGLVSSANRKNRRLISVINGFKGKDHFALARESQKLLDYGYTETKNKTYFNSDDIITKIQTWYGAKDYVQGTVKDPITITNKLNENPEIRIYTRHKTYIPAPIKKGEEIGTIYIEKNGKIIKQVPMVAAEKVNKLWFLGRIFRTINIFLTGEK